MDDTSEEFQTLFNEMSAFVTDCMSGHDPSHNPAHVHRVGALANKILEAERTLHPTTQYNGAVVKLAALLHDIGDRKYLSKMDAAPGSQELDPTTMVQYALLARGATPELASRVQTVISHVSYTTECKDPALIRRMIDEDGDLLRRLNPRDTKTNLQAITSIVPELTEDLLSSVDQPLEIRRCPQSNRDYLLCDYNRDGDSYRSPWSNEFDPPLEDGTVPSERVRKLEVAANESFDVYRELYYEGGVGSVYFWDLDDGFAGVILLKKGVTPGSQSSGEWDSIHVFEATDRARMSHYKLTSTVILHLANKTEALGDMDLSGNMTRQVEVDLPVESDASHVANVGRLVEDMELKMRNLLQEVYFGKAKDVVGELRSLGPLSDANRDRETQREMIMSMQK
ncbi:hypothetical protein DTO013E5_4326 [Penicillium roqueforti]|nr:hypothetical protein DTO012A1_7526 [Penicillium roqueforti]KAI2753798.1 hypothetical protein DTO013F2_2198 [Penicillium roqueforti]KAI2773625.1 hypothetical protein DTO012A8_1917 [Penicillium roqueforti]KAI3080670.1 hypothetical protein CBS147339_3256 [Penicillium roqueforti]KAI3106449.1 hypothetical protein CBS147338_1036 [Penicillium roqueforti]